MIMLYLFSRYLRWRAERRFEEAVSFWKDCDPSAGEIYPEGNEWAVRISPDASG